LSSGSEGAIAQAVYRVDRSYSWNYSHAPSLPRVRRVPSGQGGKLLDHRLESPLGIAAGPLLNSKWVEAYSRIGYDVLTYKTVRSMAMPAHALPNIRPVENYEHAAVATTKRPNSNGHPTLAVSMGMPSAEPEVWRKDVRRAKDRIGSGQMLIVSVVGTHVPGMDAEQLVQDYARCAAWAAEAGADAVEVHLAVPDPFAEQPQLIYENIPLAAQILYRVRTTMPKPVLAKLGVFRTPRLLHETATKLASWASGFVMVHGVRRRVVDEEGQVAFEGEGRERATIVGADTWPLASRQIEEMLSWRKAGAWDRAILAVGGITTPERADHLLREGADVALVATTALFDPLIAIRFRQMRATAVA
jgi:dihydroorotate dehydrogenase (NAD+) catalytic subunit